MNALINFFDQIFVVHLELIVQKKYFRIQ